MGSWIDSAVIYQVNLRALAAREPRNAFEAMVERPAAVSPLAYVTRHLPRLGAMGVNVVYLLPPYPIGRVGRKGIGSPYASRDFRAVEPEYGSLSDLRRLVRRAHGMGLRVILDITPNHTSRDHVWMSEHPEYYVRRDDGEAFYDLDWSDTAKLDYTQPALRRAMIETYDFWLSLLGRRDAVDDGVDGFRLDMAHFINDRSFWDEAMPELRARHPERALLFLAECYGFENNIDLFRRGIDAAYDDDFYKIAQYGYAVDARGESRVLLDPGAGGNRDFAPLFEAFRRRGIAGAVEAHLLRCADRLRETDRSHGLARYTDNHDEGRGVYRFGPGAVRALNVLAFTMPHGMPFLLTGQEFGAENRPSIHDRIRPCDKGFRSAGEGASREGVEFEGNLFARGFEARQAWYAFYRDLIGLRAAHPALGEGSFMLRDAEEEAPPEERTVVAFVRALGGERLTVCVNMGPEARRIRLDALGPLGRAHWGSPESVMPPFSAWVAESAFGKGPA